MLTLDPDPTTPHDFLENHVVRRRGMKQDGRWVDEDVLLNVQCGICDSSRRRILCPVRILGDKILANGNTINEASGQKLSEDLEL